VRVSVQQTQLPDFVAALRTGRRSSGSRFKGVWDVLENAGAKLGMDGRRKSAKPFAHPYFWSGFVYTGG
jgi:CHAT domain-containing protein